MAVHTPIPTRTAAKRENISTTIKPDIYMTVNSRQRQRNLLVLDLLQGSFTDDTKERQFLDLGCGTGDFTRDHLLPRCPKVERLVAVDVSEEMVEYARKHFAHPMICYDVLDIAAKDVTEFVKRYGQFDRVYSFYCFNWTRDQEAGFRNIAELLKPAKLALARTSLAQTWAEQVGYLGSVH
ncbi:hypothetical protein HPB47_005366 [Ixodes persulcatus]|uniref:Uncharacterized protein n=1 Tax=Ixodes persulcatus TaxID=34615 RepID=A0AC60PEE4_IXOPE|nr:hypothetical protein HPB47_005366 [Ixodes persulcatus]